MLKFLNYKKTNKIFLDIKMEVPKILKNRLSPKTDFLIDYSEENKNLLGRGQYGEVWKGTVINQSAAIKLLMDENNEETLKDLLRESKFLLKNTCNDIVLLLRICVEPGFFAIATELLDGDLKSWNSKSKTINGGNALSKISLGQKVSLIIDCARGIGYMHNQGMIHCDIKPDNIFIDTKKWKAKIGDLGLSMHKKEDITPGGTPLFSPPEALLSIKKEGSIQNKIDIYSLACTMIWIINNGKRLYPKKLNSIKKLNDYVCNKKKRPVIHNDIPKKLNNLLKLSLSEDPVYRPDSKVFLEDMLSVSYGCYIKNSQIADWWKENFRDTSTNEISRYVGWDVFSETFFGDYPGLGKISKKDRKKLKKDIVSNNTNDVDIILFSKLVEKFHYSKDTFQMKKFKKNLRDFYHQPYFPHLKDKILIGLPQGTYFLRNSRTKGSWTFSFISDEKERMIRIGYNPQDGKWYAGEELTSFDSLKKLVNHQKEKFSWKLRMKKNIVQGDNENYIQ